MVVMNEETFEERVSLVLSPLNVFVVAGSLILFLIVGTIYLIAFTGLREYIPGYADVNMRRGMVNLALKADSLERAIKMKDDFILNVQNVITGNIKDEKGANPKDTTNKYATVSGAKSRADSLFRAEIESQDKSYSLSVTDGLTNRNDISSFFFFSPLNGVVSSSFNLDESHYGVDVTAPKNEAVKATLDGTVVMVGWTLEDGYVIQVQHSNNVVSIYKHNSALLKKTGERVDAGEAISIVGNSGELTSGPHLHFELWYNGSPINPQEYINF